MHHVKEVKPDRWTVLFCWKRSSLGDNKMWCAFEVDLPRSRNERDGRRKVNS